MLMVTYLLITVLAGVLFGILAGVYVGVWAQPGFVLDGLAALLYEWKNRHIENGPCERIDARTRQAEWLLKPILTCGYCVGGQMGLWGLVFLTYLEPLPLLCYILSAGVASFVGGLVDQLILPK